MTEEKTYKNCIQLNRNNRISEESVIKPFAYYIEVYEHNDKGDNYIMQTKEYKSEKILVNKYNNLIVFTNVTEYDFYLMGLFGSSDNYDVRCIKKLEFR